MTRVRPAAAEDFEAATRLLEELGRPPVGPAETARAREIWLAQVEDPEHCHLVAEEDGKVSGFLSLVFRPRLNHTSPQAWVPDLIVDPAARRNGIGRLLVEEAESRSRARGCDNLTLESGYQRAEAHHLYRRCGMSDTGKQFTKGL